MSLPIIGISTRKSFTAAHLPSISIQRAYTDSILQAGGTPVLLPSDLPQENWQGLFERLDGLLFTGGGDIAVQRYGGQFHPAVSGIDESRDNLELGLARQAAASGKPFLGVCRGLQVVNVALGGSLYEDLSSQTESAFQHTPPGPDGLAARTQLQHPVILQPNSRARAILGVDSLYVNSLHHQGIRALGQGLSACGHAPDGLVEVVELEKHPFGLAVQFHPEWLGDQEAIRRLWRAFVEACRRP